MNADRKLNFFQRIQWMIRAFLAYILDVFVVLKAQQVKNIKLQRIFSAEKASPTRMYTENLIYEYIPWGRYKKDFGEVFICVQNST